MYVEGKIEQKYFCCDLKFVYDGWQCIAEMNATNNTVIRSYVWGTDLSGTQTGVGGVGGLLIMNDVQNGTHFYGYDGNGNIALMVNCDNGKESANFEYGPFGEVIRATGPIARVNPFRWSTQYTDDETDLVCYLHRYYNLSMGRWLSRDPVESASRNCYGFVGNDPVGGIDYLGLWDTRIHRDATKRWALKASYPGEAAQAIADADEAVDEKFGSTSYITEPGTQYHFDRSLSMGGSEDTRMVKYKEHLQKAKDLCTAAKGNDDPQASAKQYGTALHPYQDWVAHGDHNKRLLGSFSSYKDIHNYMSPVKGSTGFPDDSNLDAKGSPDGRATLSVLHFVPADNGNIRDWADYEPGHKRYQLTHSMSSSSLNEFREYVRANGGCKCKKYFGVE